MLATRNTETELFRPEAVQFQLDRRQWGEIIDLHPTSLRTMSWLTVFAVVIAAAFLSTARYSRKETVPGYVSPSLGTAKIYVPQQGVVRDVHVALHEHVRKGQAVLTVETPQLAENGRDVNLASVTTLMDQRIAIAGQIEAEQRKSVSEKARLAALLASQNAEITILQGQIRLQEDRLGLARSTLASSAQLSAKGYLAEVEFKRRQQEVIDLEQNLSALNQQHEVKRGQITETSFAQEQLPTVRSDKIQSLRNDLYWVEQRIIETNGKRAYVVPAPVSGTVSILQATSGGVALPQTLQMTLLPDGSTLRAELLVPSRAIGFVRLGQPVRIRYQAFPYQKYGTHTGRVEAVSASAVNAGEAAGPLRTNDPVYRVGVSLDASSVSVNGHDTPLRPDMLLEADIVLDSRSLVGWMLDPLAGSRNVLDTGDTRRQFDAWIVAPLRAALGFAVEHLPGQVAWSAFVRAWEIDDAAPSSNEWPEPKGEKQVRP